MIIAITNIIIIWIKFVHIEASIPPAITYAQIIAAPIITAVLYDTPSTDSSTVPMDDHWETRYVKHPISIIIVLSILTVRLPDHLADRMSGSV